MIDFSNTQNWVLPVLIGLFFVWRTLKSKKIKKALPELKAKGAVVLDVRSRGEFQAGSTPGSLNIPLDELTTQLKKGVAGLDPSKPVVVCCASGARSAMAASILKSQGFSVVLNAGAWQNTL